MRHAIGVFTGGRAYGWGGGGDGRFGDDACSTSHVTRCSEKRCGACRLRCSRGRQVCAPERRCAALHVTRDAVAVEEEGGVEVMAMPHQARQSP